jgi:hypothetical protein
VVGDVVGVAWWPIRTYELVIGSWLMTMRVRSKLGGGRDICDGRSIGSGDDREVKMVGAGEERRAGDDHRQPRAGRGHEHGVREERLAVEYDTPIHGYLGFRYGFGQVNLS